MGLVYRLGHGSLAASGQRPRRLLASRAAGLWRGAEAAGVAAAMR